MRSYPERRKTLNVLKEANLAWGSFDDFPVIPKGVEPSPHLSRSSSPQPFYLVTSKDEVLVTMSGEGEVRFHDPEQTVLTIGPGDVVYLPARLPARIVPHSEMVQVRLKDAPPFTEAVAWFCESCGSLLHKVEFTADVPQKEYWAAATEFSADMALRTCGWCGDVAEPLDLTDFAWSDIAEVLEEPVS